MENSATTKTIADFDEQWANFTSNDGHYASTELLADLLGPLLSTSDLRGARVADIGSGTGRIVNMLAGVGASHIVGVEPASRALAVAKKNTAHLGDRVEFLNVTGDKLPPSGDLDFVVSFGVLHHIPEPAPVVRAAFNALKPGGKMVVWLYGHEGNELYLGVVSPLRRLTTHIPHRALDLLSRGLEVPLTVYGQLCRYAPLPMKDYMVNHINKLSREVRAITIYDQLNPTYAKYYHRHEAEALLGDAGFVDVGLYHRHGYSWTVIGTKPG